MMILHKQACVPVCLVVGSDSFVMSSVAAATAAFGTAAPAVGLLSHIALDGKPCNGLRRRLSRLPECSHADPSHPRKWDPEPRT